MPDSNIYERAIDIIAKRRLDAKQNYENNYKIAEEKIPEIVEINRQLANTSLELFNIIKAGGDDMNKRLEELKIRNLQAQDMVENLLVQNNFPRDFLNIKYTCEICSDTGFVQNSRCKCLQELIRELSVKVLNSHSQIKLCSFKTFKLDYYKNIITSDGTNCYEAMSHVLSYCMKYAYEFSLNSKSIFMLGNTGLGKTHLSLSIAEKVIEKGYKVLYDSIINYLRQIEKEHFGRDTSGTDTLGLILDADLVILDDLGSEHDTSFYVSTIYNIVNTRLNKGLPTIINTNLTPQELESKYEPRLVSRLFAMYDYLKFIGNDIRHIKKKNGEL
ncbi:MAG: ATP-binding protein [Clostridiales bacterium]|nr:ATP-binding protein [Clostridiales bacterium]